MYCKNESQEVSSRNVDVMLKCFYNNSNYGSTVGKSESDVNDDSDFEILLHFDAAIVVELF